ncbi:hypothetical protein A2767_05700 [Candidatus Roizmanbacteria bacterium RIFCSPHIGHO2_01_FULL_35_10]|nr:MAG: hypothetical protein A2767_05700 [Candidatus Roizmanbacteria bacterium RIFCSPHIGHO2_01_FULL_35_10]
MKKILIIEDDLILLQMYETKFKHAGFEVETALDGVAGLEKIKIDKPDFVLLDIVMPKLNGKALFEKVRFDPELQKIPIAILTNVENPKDRVELLNKGVVEYFIKSETTPAQVVEKVQTILSHG